MNYTSAKIFGTEELLFTTEFSKDIPPQNLRTAELFASMHLQWFAAEDEGRTEEPTEQKIRSAREEGKVARSQDLTGTIVLLAGIIILAILGQNIFNAMQDSLRYFISFASEPEIQGNFASAFLSFLSRMVLPIAIISIISAIAANIFQVGFLFSVKPITPDFQRIAPNFARYFKRVLFSTEALFNLSKGILKVVVILVIAVINIVIRIGDITALVRAHYMNGFLLIGELAFAILIQACILMLVFSVVDYWFQRRVHRESLKMTKEEVKEERKNYEGDPLVKSRLRQRMREILQSNMLRYVPDADVVVTNPTHYAVALEYKRERMDAPTVVAKGKDHLAERIKNIAHEHGVPVMENKPLARALYADVEIGSQVPVRHYQAVAELLKLVFRMNGEKEAV